MGHLLVAQLLPTFLRQQCLGARLQGSLQVVVLVHRLELSTPRQELVTQPGLEVELVVVALQVADKTRIRDLATIPYRLAGRTLVTTAARRLDAGQTIKMLTIAVEKSAAVATAVLGFNATAAHVLL